MSVNNMHKIEVTAPLHAEAAALAEVANILSLPDEKDRQPDLQYLTAIFVSSGMNKNGAVFMGSELVKARGTINNKAVDIEHDDRSIIGQITGRTFLNRDRSQLDVERAAGMPVELQDELEIDVGIAAIVHKARFPELAQEIQDGQWTVSMEAYYRDYDVKVGEMVIPREKAEELGFDKMIGSVVQLRDGEKEMGFHLVGRVLRDIMFAGAGIVRNPANPRSIIMEAAAMDEYIDEESKKETPKIINLADVNTLATEKQEDGDEEKITKEFIVSTVQAALAEALAGEKEKEDAGLPLNHVLPGTCVSYKRYVYAYPGADTDDLPEPFEDLTQYPLVGPARPGAESPDVRVIGEHYCSLFDMECSARPGDATSPTCWRNVFARTVREELFNHEKVLRMKRVQEGLVDLQNLLDHVKGI